jgi:hypothetical protein
MLVVMVLAAIARELGLRVWVKRQGCRAAFEMP